MRNFSSRFLHFFFFAFFFNMQRIVRRKMSGREPKNGGREGRENRKEGRRDDEAGTNGLRQPLTAQKLLTLFFSETSPKNEKSSERPRFFFIIIMRKCVKSLRYDRLNERPSYQEKNAFMGFTSA